MPANPFAGLTQPAFTFPNDFQPGTTDNFVSNEVVVPHSTAVDIWHRLVDLSDWKDHLIGGEATWEESSSSSSTSDGAAILTKGARFTLKKFNLPALSCEVTHAVPPVRGQAGSLAWRATSLVGSSSSSSSSPPDDRQRRLETYHAWLVEDLGEGRVRIRSQEVQSGLLAKELREERPSTVVGGAWGGVEAPWRPVGR